MRKVIMKATFVAAVALVAAMSVQRLDNQKTNMSALLLANVEALAQSENTTKYYNTMHYKVYANQIWTGKCTASCYHNPLATRGPYHAHDATTCCTNP